MPLKAGGGGPVIMPHCVYYVSVCYYTLPCEVTLIIKEILSTSALYTNLCDVPVLIKQFFFVVYTCTVYV